MDFHRLVKLSKGIIVCGFFYVMYLFFREDSLKWPVTLEGNFVRLKKSLTSRRSANPAGDVKYIGLAFTYCNGLANQMQRHASLIGIGDEIGRTPFIDHRYGCAFNVLPELAAAMPNFYAGIRLLEPDKPKKWAVPFNLNICQYVNSSVLAGKYDAHKFLKLRSHLLQSYKYFHGIKPKIREVFRFSDEQTQFVDRFAKELMGDSKTHKLCVHIRRGDFVRHQFLMPSKHSFITPALKFLTTNLTNQHGKLGLIYIGENSGFTKNIQYDKNHVKEVFTPSGLSRTQDLLFGSKYCDSLLISASGSTYGWWMGYLMDERKQNSVFYNYLATKGAKDCRDRFDFDTYPPEWTRLRLTKGGKDMDVVVEKRWHREIKAQEGAEVYQKWLKL